MKRPLLWAEAGLWMAGVVLAAVGAAGALEARGARRQADAVVEHSEVRGHKAGEVIGRLEIPGLSLSVPVLESYEPDTLRRGVGHIPGSAVPGGLGNLVLAGHRDTFFRPLKNVKAGMEIDVATANGRFAYSIDSTEIVTPEQVEIMDIGDRPGMTLITCYPFEYVGQAPKRFIVHAHLVSDPA